MVVVDEQRRGQHAAHFHHKHHRVLDHPARIELAQLSISAWAMISVFQRLFFSAMTVRFASSC